MEIESGYQYALVKVVRELQIMQYLNNSIPKNSGMKQFFAGLLDLFCPRQEMEQKNVRNLFLVMPLSEQNLSELAEDSQVELQSAKVILYNLLCALNFLHSSNIVHRDIKP